MSFISLGNGPYYGLQQAVPPIPGGGGSSGGSVGQNTQSTSSGASQSGSYFADPRLTGKVGNALGGVIGQVAPGYANFVNDPTSSPAFQNALSGALAALAPGERQGQMNLADAYRAAGNIASSSYGQALNKYQQGVDRNRMSMTSDLLTKLYPQIAGAMFAPLAQTPSLIGSEKLDKSVSQQQSQSTSSPSFGPFGGQGGLFGQVLFGNQGGGVTGQTPGTFAMPSWWNAPQGGGSNPMSGSNIPMPKYGAGF